MNDESCFSLEKFLLPVDKLLKKENDYYAMFLCFLLYFYTLTLVDPILIVDTYNLYTKLFSS